MSSQRVKLTESFIDQLELKPAIYRDSELIGFAVRVNNSYKTYIVEKKVLGKSVRSTLGRCQNMALFQARKMAKETLLQMFQGVNPNQEKKKNSKREVRDKNRKLSQPTVKGAFNAYLKTKILKKRTRDDYIIVIDKYLKDWHCFQLNEISQKMVQQKYAELSKNSKAQANMAMRVFRAVYNFSIDYYLNSNQQPILNLYNPVKILGQNKVWNQLNKKQHDFHQDQLDRWVDAIFQYKERGQSRETNRDLLLTMFLTGLNKKQCESLCWTCVDLKNGTLTTKSLKNENLYILPMGDYLFDLMKKRKKNIQGKWVFPSMKSEVGHVVNISKVINKINDICGIKFTFSDLQKIHQSISENLDVGHDTMKIGLYKKSSYKLESSMNQANNKNLRLTMNEIENILLKEHKVESFY